MVLNAQKKILALGKGCFVAEVRTSRMIAGRPEGRPATAY
jgi:hypothetical protein